MNYWLLYFITWIKITVKRWSKTLAINRSDNFQRFVILCAPRSGSTLLHTYLNFHPNIMSYGEILRRTSGADHRPIPGLDQLAYSPHPSNIKAVGLKLFYEYSTQREYQQSFIEVVNNCTIKVIHLTREDPLASMVSIERARLNNDWNSSRPSLSQGSIEIDRQEYLDYKEARQRSIEYHRGEFKHHKVLEITYEQLVDNKDNTLTKVQEFLGVPPRKLFSLLRKRNTLPIEQLITNYEEIKHL